eukprot:EG_transcript_32102
MGAVVTKPKAPPAPQFGPPIATTTAVGPAGTGAEAEGSPTSRGPPSSPSPRCVSPALHTDAENEHSNAVHLSIENEPDSEKGSTSSSTSRREDHLQWSITAQCASFELGGGVSPQSPQPPGPGPGAQVDFSTIDVEQMWERGRRVGRGAFSEVRLCLAQVGTGVFFVAKRITVHGIVWEDLKANPGGGGASEIR